MTKRDICLLIFVISLYGIGIFNTFSNVVATASLVDAIQVEDEEVVIINEKEEDYVLNIDRNSVDFMISEIEGESDIVIYCGSEVVNLYDKKGDVLINISHLLSNQEYNYVILINGEVVVNDVFTTL
jgi:hypothetical protein